MWPAPAFAPMPCLMAFSTSGCSSNVGTSAWLGVVWDRHGDFQAIAESRALNIDVAIEQRQFLRQRHAIDEPGVQRLTQQMTEAADHPLSGGRLLVHQLRDGIERVEQEMWLQLHAQHLQSRLREQRFELRGPQLAVRAILDSTARRA